MFGPGIQEEYERVRDRVENGLAALTAAGNDCRYLLKVCAGALVVCAAALVCIAAGTVFG